MKQAVVECVAFDRDKSGGANVSNADGARGYFEAAAVSLYSMRKSNPQVDAVLVTNIDVPADVQELLESFGCRIIRQPFDSFCFPYDVPWHLAYYKLCALEAVVNLGDYDQLAMVDTDTWFRGDLAPMFRDAEDGLMLYRLHPRAGDRDLVKMQGELASFAEGRAGNGDCFFGGEMVCGTAGALEEYLAACKAVQAQMIEKSAVSERGDEFLVFAAAAEGLLPSVVSANPYIHRLWTGRYWSVVSRWDDLAILHLPAEKVFSFPRAYRRLSRRRSIDGRWFERSCGLRGGVRPFSPLWMAKRSLDKLLKR